MAENNLEEDVAVIEETPEQLAIEKEIKAAAQKFLKYLNSTIPPDMELEYEGFYRRGFFVTKKRYAVMEDGKIIAKGLELVRRDWAPIAKDTQEAVLMGLLSEGNLDKAIKAVTRTLKRVRSGEATMDEMIIHTQITKKLSSYKNVGPHVEAAKRLEAKGMSVKKGNIIQYVIVKGKGPISKRAMPYEQSGPYKYDADYYINNQIIPAVGRIMESLGYTKEDLTDLSFSNRQSSLDAFF